MKPPKNKKCESCDFCKRLYRELWYSSVKSKAWYCTEKEIIIQPLNVCESWRKKKTNYDLSPRRFDDAQKDIVLIMKYLKDL